MKIAKTRNVKTPSRGTDGSAGIDFYVPNDFNGGKPLHLGPQESINIPSGIHVRIPRGYALIAFNKSGVALKSGLQVGACVVDEDYQGEVHLHVVNVSSQQTVIYPGNKLVQFLLIPLLMFDVDVVRSVEDLHPEKSDRGAGGFGSTGNN